MICEGWSEQLKWPLQKPDLIPSEYVSYELELGCNPGQVCTQFHYCSRAQMCINSQKHTTQSGGKPSQKSGSYYNRVID